MMASLFEAIRRWRVPIVCFAWLFAFVTLLQDRRYETFLTAGFVPMLILASAVLVPMACAALARRPVPPIGVREALATAVLLLPLAYVYQARNTTLGASALAARYVGGAGVPGMLAARAAEGGGITMVDLFTEPERYDGQTVTVAAMLMKGNAQVREVLGADHPLAFRFVITCCAADAIPLALVLEGVEVDALADETWIEATGRFAIRNTGPHEILIMENAVVSETPRPAQPYLYSVWGLF